MSGWDAPVECLARSPEYLREIAIIRSDTMQALLAGAALDGVVRTARQLYAAAWRREQDRAPSRYLPTAPLPAPAPAPTKRRATRRAA